MNAPEWHMVWRFIVTLSLAVSGWCQEAAKISLKPFGVKEAIEMTRVVEMHGESLQYSPDRAHYLVVVERGDLKRNGTWVRILTGAVGSVSAAGAPETAVNLFTQAKGEIDDLVKKVRWVGDSRRITFLLNDGESPTQIWCGDRGNGSPRKLTTHPTEIWDYDIAQDARTVIFQAEPDQPISGVGSARPWGFAVELGELYTILNGGRIRNSERNGPGSIYIMINGGKPRAVDGLPLKPFHGSRSSPVRISPDGRFAIVVRAVERVPAEWRQYSEKNMKRLVEAAERDPEAMGFVSQFWVIDTVDLTVHPLWNAPLNWGTDLVFSPDGRHALIGPSFTPPLGAEAQGLEGNAIAEIDLTTGAYRLIPLPPNAPMTHDGAAPGGYRPIRWSDPDLIELGNAQFWLPEKLPLWMKREGSEWHVVPENDRVLQAATAASVELHEGPNTPPQLVVVDKKSGERKVVLDLNPQLNSFSLGQVELVHWQGRNKLPYTGLLYHPPGAGSGHASPLVIAMHGFREQKFDVDGMYSTAYAAQALANRGIAVLLMRWPDQADIGTFMGTQREVEIVMDGCEGAIDHFSALGLIDRKKVGLVGFSRPGWYVEYILTHSLTPYAAALVADNFDSSYIQYTLNFMAEGDAFGLFNDSPPFGEGLKKWLLDAPGFNADKVRAPLSLQIDSGGHLAVLGAWEMFARLSYLKKPAELFVIPDIEHGSHILQNPGQRFASQGRTVDWFDFWLQGHERTEPVVAAGETEAQLAEKYARWHKLRAWHEAVLRKGQESENVAPAN